MAKTGTMQSERIRQQETGGEGRKEEMMARRKAGVVVVAV
jgi:hypothetical protein